MPKAIAGQPLELWKPLNSGDPQDMNVIAGDTIGIYCAIIDYTVYPTKGIWRWPPDATGCLQGLAQNWGKLVTCPIPPSVPAITPSGFLLALISLFGLAAVAMRRVYKR